MNRAVFLTVVACILMTGCTSATSNSSSDTEIDVKAVELPSVAMNGITPPHFMKKFGVLYFDSTHRDILWGGTDDPILTGFFWDDSSFPGFAYTVLVQLDYFDGAESVEMVTYYGSYSYTLDKSYSVFKEDGHLINRETGEDVNLLDADNERLAIYNSVTNTVYDYKLAEGTYVRVE